ncbi:hypothetical protein RF11_06872 [Thelohanellus kitauei]|uniref:Uncharacterized protein n=1 Tax=Thelohanellus kitauei TaxID=669202 RepID=A0A0C2M5A7_THEKT|nr:hypothetical protein RF11_06872 [Thelohanellus kitauei]
MDKLACIIHNSLPCHTRFAEKRAVWNLREHERSRPFRFPCYKHTNFTGQLDIKRVLYFVHKNETCRYTDKKILFETFVHVQNLDELNYTIESKTFGSSDLNRT